MPAVSAETAYDVVGNHLRDYNGNFQVGYGAEGCLARLSLRSSCGGKSGLAQEGVFSVWASNPLLHISSRRGF